MKATPSSISLRRIISVFFAAGALVAAAMMYIAWDHNSQGEIHDETGIHWGYWLFLGITWFAAIGVVPSVLAFLVCCLHRLFRGNLTAMHEFYSIPEQVCRNLPDEIPGRSGIRIVGVDFLRPTESQPTASSILFVTSRRTIVLLGVGPSIPESDPGVRRDMLYALLYYKTLRSLIFDRNPRCVKSFLRSIGATLLGTGRDHFEKEVARREKLIQSRKQDAH